MLNSFSKLLPGVLIFIFRFLVVFKFFCGLFENSFFSFILVKLVNFSEKTTFCIFVVEGFVTQIHLPLRNIFVWNC
jgi:hypothetical protein